MKSTRARRAAWRKSVSVRRARSIERRLSRRQVPSGRRPVLSRMGVTYEVARDATAVQAGGIGLMHRLVQQVRLPQAIDRRVQLLAQHQPYHESDHVLSLAYNILAGGTCIEDLERWRQDEGFLDALGAARLPDPTTAGDFCRRFAAADVRALMAAIDDARLRVWARQDAAFFEEAVIDADGTLVATDGERKEGCDFAYDGTFGCHPLLVSLRNTQEPLCLLNRSGNRPSHDGAAAALDAAIELCRSAGFRRVRLQGDTDFSQSAHLDRWHAQGIGFLFGWDAAPNLVLRAKELPPSAWSKLDRPERTAVTAPRERRVNQKDQVVAARGYKTLTTTHEEVADFAYQPAACSRDYRMVVLKKTIRVVQGQQQLQDEVRYFFFITNDRQLTPGALVLRANGRCDQENLIAQLKHGVHALRLPVGDQVSNWAYMVITSLAWTLKAWLALLLPRAAAGTEAPHDDRQRLLRMEFKRFRAGMLQVPALVVRTGRRIILRLLAWNPLQRVFLRAADLLERPLRC